MQHWAGLAFERGPAATPTAATKRTWRLPADADPAEAIEPALEELKALADHPGLHSTALAIDPRHWELVHFTRWSTAPDTGEGVVRFQVPHLSRPELDDLSAGRQW